ncbi:hypothetical protein DXA95_03400 [Odoribacter sp. OF09-27XD]|nr:hypothetical protein DXA95_03400 [Odoribacter sp. OF09-27XD]
MILKSFISDKLFCGKFYAGCGIFLRFCLYKLKNALYLHSLKKNVLLHNVKIAQLVEHDLAPGIIKSDLGKMAFQKSES